MISPSDADSILTAVEVVDDGRGPVVALAHGAGGGVRENFGPVIEAGRGRRRFVGPNYPGVGSTPMPDGPLDLDVLADQVVAAGVHAGAARFPVLGLSLGAAVATTAAIRHPEHVSALVLTVGVARADPQSRAFAAAWRALAATGDYDALAQLLLYAVGTADSLAAIPPEAHAAAVAEIRRTYPPGGIAHAELVARVNVTPLLPDVAVPTLVVVGGQDRIVLPATAREFAAIRGAELIEYPAAGHIFDAVESARWAGDVLAFLDGAQPATAARARTAAVSTPVGRVP